MDKEKTLEAIAHELSEGLGKDGWLKRVGNVFFRCGHLNGNQVEDVYHASMRHNLNIELISMDWHYFTGTKEHAMALQKALGGGVWPSEYITAKDSMDLLIWMGPDRILGDISPLNLETIKKIICADAD